jgi:predicted RNase H-like nuclease (RuvC/YqgF family)
LKQKESEFARELDIEKSKVNEEKRETLKQKTRNDEINLALAEANEATQEASQKLHAIQKELEKAKNEIVLKNQDKDIAFANLEKCKAEILALQKSDQDQKQLISKLQANLDQASKHASTRLEKINNLEKSNRLLQETNMQLQERQQALERELIKAQAQIELITDLL